MIDALVDRCARQLIKALIGAFLLGGAIGFVSGWYRSAWHSESHPLSEARISEPCRHHDESVVDAVKKEFADRARVVEVMRRDEDVQRGLVDPPPQIIRVTEKDGKLFLPDGKPLPFLEIGGKRILPKYVTKPPSKRPMDDEELEAAWQRGDPKVWKLEYPTGVEE